MSRYGHQSIGKWGRILCVLGCVWAGAAALGAGDSPVAGALEARARIVLVENSHATVAFEPQAEVVGEMVKSGILRLTGQTEFKAAWRSLVSPTDVVGLKVYSGPGRNSGTRPAVVEAVVRVLLAAGLPPSNIIVWDKRLVDLRLAGFSDLTDRYQIRLAGSSDAGYDDQVFYDDPVMGSLVAGDLDFDRSGATSEHKST